MWKTGFSLLRLFSQIYIQTFWVALITLCTPNTDVEALFLLHLQPTDRFLSLSVCLSSSCINVHRFPVSCGVCGVVPFSPLWLSRSSAAASLSRHNALTCVHVRATWWRRCCWPYGELVGVLEQWSGRGLTWYCCHRLLDCSSITDRDSSRDDRSQRCAISSF